VPALLAEIERLQARVAELEAQAATARANGYQRAIEVMRAEHLPMSVGLLEAQRDLDALDAKDGGLPTAYVMACAQCDGLLGWIACPTGGWWSHREHPADDHDAEPVPVVALNEGGER
jgi:hypothetical protein